MKIEAVDWREVDRWPAVIYLLPLIVGVLLAQLPLLWAAGLVGGTAVFLLILIQPLFGLGLALLLGPFGALEKVIFGNPILDSGQIILWLTIAIWLVRGLRRRRIIIPQTILNGPLLLFLFVMALTLLDSPSILLGLKELLKWVEILLIVWLVVDEGGRLKTPRQVPLLVMLLTAGTVQAVVGIWQFGLRETGPEHFLVLSKYYRAYGTFEQPNPFGGYMNLSALLVLGVLVGYGAYYWQSRGAGEQGSGGVGVRGRRKNAGSGFPCSLISLLLLGGITAVTTIALIASWSRGAWLGFAAGTAVLIFSWPRKKWQGMLLLSLAVLGLLLAVQFNLIHGSITSRIDSFSQDLQFGDVRGVDINDSNYAVLERLAHWQAALEMAREEIWLGVGFGNYEPAYAEYALINWPAPLGHAHNYYLNLLGETGVLGLAAYLLLWTAVFRQTNRLIKRLDWPHRGIALGLYAAWTAMATHHLVDKLYVNNIYIHLGVMFGLLQLLEHEDTKQENWRLYSE